ncbi:Dicarboxylate transport [Mariprofundus ferrinatatus]|uniref:Dicarboxylate transport n=1 Tax=Mariprofundus ferrinatatus TaxID=1921087 RepID=A0A2K8L691_9PROT|nr:YdbH domain-containing protein [Mariprofundus ferrinatatus]ATX82807.1 Dicarboxylate transport [Mariprofundus ferrinatatus]
MRWRTTLTAITGFVILMIATAWLTAPWWLAVVARDQFAGYGFTVKAIEIDRVGLHGSRLARLHIRQSSGDIEADIDTLSLTYSLSRLLSGQLDGLSIANLQLSLHPASQKTDAGVVLFAPAALMTAVPVDRIEISKISMRRLDSEGTLLQELAGKAHLQEGILAIELGEPYGENPLQARFTMDEKGALQALLRRGDREMLRIDTVVREQAGQLSIKGELQAELAPLDREARQWVELPDYQLRGNLHASWSGHLPTNRPVDAQTVRTLLHFTATVALDAEAVTAKESHALLLNSTIDYERGSGSWSIADNSRLVLASGRQHTRFTPASAAGTFALHEYGWHFGINQSAALHASNLQLDDLSLNKGSLKLLQPLKLTLVDEKPVQLETPASITVQAPQIRSGKNSIYTSSIRVDLHAGALTSPRGNFSLQGLRLATDSLTLPDSALTGSFDLSHDPATASGKLESRDNNIRLKWQLTHLLDDRRGTLNYTLQPLSLGPDGFDISRLTGGKDEYALQSGQVSGKGTLSWRGSKREWQLHNRSDIDVAALQGFYKSNTFSGLSGHLMMGVGEQAINLSSDNLVVGEINTGIPVRNLSMRTDVSYPFKGPAIILISRLQADALGGHISSEKIDINLKRSSNPFVVRLDRLDAKQIAEIQAQEGLYADGTLDGTLPFDWTKNGIRLIQGRLTARDPGGVIRYLGSESIRSLAASDQMTKMALDILSDLRYWKLDIGVDADQSGQMMLHIELKGKNPGYENGRPVEFNFNIEQNVLKLLYSLRMADEIGGRLEKRMQKKLQKQ